MPWRYRLFLINRFCVKQLCLNPRKTCCQGYYYVLKFIALLWQEVRLAIEYIVIPGGEAVELLPRRSEIIDRQLELVQSYQLAAEKSGTDQNTRLQILPLRVSAKNSSKTGSVSHKKRSSTSEASAGVVGGSNGSSVSRLPILPE